MDIVIRLILIRSHLLKDFTTSWRDGMAFNAMLHNQRPDVVDYDKLNPANHTANLNNAFNIAHQKVKMMLDKTMFAIAFNFRLKLTKSLRHNTIGINLGITNE